MHRRVLISGPPRVLPPLPPSPAPPCLPCVEGRQCTAPHSSSFPPTEAPLQTLHLDVWGPAHVREQGHERYFLRVVDEYTCYTTVFPLRTKAFFEEHDITQLFTLPASPQQNGVAERRIGLVMEVARTSMIHAAAPHFLWPFAVRLAMPFRDTTADKLSAHAVPCVFLGFVPDAPGWQFYHPTSRHVFPSQDVTFDESVPFYRLFPYRTTPLTSPPLFLAPGAPQVDPLPTPGPAPSCVSQVDPPPLTAPVEVTGDSGPAEGGPARGATSGGAEPGGAEPGSAEPGGAESGAAEGAGAGGFGAATGASAGGSGATASAGAGGSGAAAGAGAGGSGVAAGAGAGGSGATAGAGAEGSGAAAGAGAGGSGAAAEAGAGGSGAAAGAGAEGSKVALLELGALPLEVFLLSSLELGVVLVPEVLVLEVLELLGLDVLLSLRVLLLETQGLGVLLLETLRLKTLGLEALVLGVLLLVELVLEELALRVLELLEVVELLGVLELLVLVALHSRACSSLHRLRRLSHRLTLCFARFLVSLRLLVFRYSLAHRCLLLLLTLSRQGPTVPVTHLVVHRLSSPPQRVPLPSPPASSLPTVPEPESDRTRAAHPFVTRLLATVVTDPSFESAAASAFVAELVDFAAACRLDYAASLTAAPHLVSMLLAPEGDPDAPNIPTPRSYAEAIAGEYSSQWQTAIDAEMASWKSTSTYVDEVPPPGANIISGMWIFRMTTLWVLLHVAAQRDYELHSLDFSTAFLQGSLHEEIWLRRPLGFTGSFPSGTQWSLQRPVYGLRQAPREWHDTLRTTLAALGFAPSTADSSLFLRTDTSLPPFYILVYVDDLVFATADTEALALVKSELQKRHTCTDLGELRSYLGLQITRDRARRTITLT
ncbi:unnamed protein product [Closterium sp. NIES-64]|nr:unnamed protein product [Closterium sp. NIES-64]